MGAGATHNPCADTRRDDSKIEVIVVISLGDVEREIDAAIFGMEACAYSRVDCCCG